jgi:hypothetical protein
MYLAVDLIEKRLQHAFGGSIRKFEVHGFRVICSAHRPRSGKRVLSSSGGRYLFGDKGIDGVIRFFTSAKGDTGRTLVSVKGGKMIGPGLARELLGAVETQNAEMGVLVAMAKPTPGMKDAVDHAGMYRCAQRCKMSAPGSSSATAPTGRLRYARADATTVRAAGAVVLDLLHALRDGDQELVHDMR